VRNRSRSLAALSLAAAAPALLGAGPVTTLASISATVTGLRSSEGQVLACLTVNAKRFPNCERDLDAHKLIVPANASVELVFNQVPAGTYAIALVHDENGNGKLDKRLMMPAEGFGFSRDAKVRMGPPSFSSAAFPVNGQDQHKTIRMRYMF
jgi:uncharacterized protein (DUF2141 family)